MATQKGWNLDQRGWPLAFFITAAVHAGLLLQVDSGLFTTRKPDVSPLITISLLAAPAKSSQAVITPPPAMPVDPPKPVASPPAERPRPGPVTQKQTPKPRRVVKPPDAPAPPDHLQAMTSVAPPAAGPVAVADMSLEPPHTNAAYLNNPPPSYPRILLRRRVEGTVLVRAQVQDDGRCSQVKIKESSGFDLFDRAALSAVRDWRFVPARKGAQTVVAWVDVPIAFRIERSR